MEEIIDAWVSREPQGDRLYELIQKPGSFVYRCCGERETLFEGEGKLPSEAILNAGWAAMGRLMEG